MKEIKILDDLNSPYIKKINDIILKWINIERIDNIKNGIINNTYPITIILLKDNELIGFYQIVEHDNDNTSYTPWIANVYVLEEYRGLGYGRVLIESIPDFMKELNIKTIYLHTRHINLYEKFGFEKYQELVLEDNIKRFIYKLDI